MSLFLKSTLQEIVHLLHTETSISCHSQSTRLHTELNNCHGNGPSVFWERNVYVPAGACFP